MSALDDVRGVPGGGELADLAATLVGDPAAADLVAGSWNTAAGTGRDRTATVRTAVGDLDAAWQGAGADAFVTYMDQAGRAGDTLQNALAICATHLSNAGEALRVAETQATQTCQEYAAAVRDYQGKNPQLTADQVADAVRPMAGEARARLEQQKASADGALGTAAAGIRGVLDGLRAAVAGLPEPDTQVFAPAPGRSLDWSPGQEPDGGTALAATSGGSLPGFGGYGPSGPPPAGGGPAPQGQVAGWISQAVTILKAQGYPVDKMNANDIWLIIRHESGGNPNAINNWDSNAARGTPSKGLMQTIDPTFDRWKLPGHENIYNPVDNIIAGVRYAVERYGSVSNVPGVVGTKTGGGYQGY